MKNIVDSAECPDEITLPDTLERDAVYYAKQINVDHTVIDRRAKVDLYALISVLVSDSLKVEEIVAGVIAAQTVMIGCTDATNTINAAGFTQTSTGDYLYDAAGNMIHDPNKNIQIFYNHLNLPYKVVRSGNIPEEIHLQYDSKGNKLFQETYKDGALVSRRDYINGIEYKDMVFENLQHESGRFVSDGAGGYTAQYHLKDNVGNIRMTIADIDKDGVLDASTEVLESRAYYPNGLAQGSVMNNTTPEPPVRRGFTSNELIREMNLGIMDFNYRSYDPATAKFWQVDPETDAPNLVDWSPYHYSYSNPISYSDPDGRNPIRGLTVLKRVFKSGKRLKKLQKAYKAGKLKQGLKTFVVDEVKDNAMDMLVPGMSDAKDIISVGKWLKKGAKKLIKKSSKYDDVTKSSRGKRSVSNKETDVTKQEFEQNLEDAGYEKTKLNDEVTKFEKDGSSYTTRPSNSGQPSADFRKDATKDKADTKIRLEEDNN